MRNASKLDRQWRDLVAKVSGLIDLDSSARAAGALVRRREISSGAALLRLALAYGPGGLSLRTAAAWAGASGLADLSDTAVMNRLRSAADWLGQIAGVLVRQGHAARAASAVLPGRRLRIIDGSAIARPGSAGTDWRLHATYDPAAGRFTDLALTDEHGAESFTRATLGPGDVALGDRFYAKPWDLRAVLDRGADFVARVGWSSLRLLRPDGTPVAWAEVFASLAPGQVAEHRVVVERSGKGGKLRGRPLFEARRIVRRSTPEASQQAERRVRRTHSRRPGSRLHPLTLQAAGFVMVLTSLPAEVRAGEVLAAYRVRWQVELAFKRLKTQLGLDRLPAKSPQLARSWLFAHLILALLVDDMTQDLLDSPPCAGSNAPTWRLTVAPDAHPAGRAPCGHPRPDRPRGVAAIRRRHRQTPLRTAPTTTIPTNPPPDRPAMLSWRL